ncbi:MAG TPA: DEAD/DEAH box helicase [Clostridia bacterium]|nr:DEAD/DEAH box helicase [Clostridia bacterium]HPQ46868.1 DEAD/DEAH box helicase [Clostridia bacterium]HRX41151.1 DEAD/DEAH box helicase [Clostridia bacterium]
MEKIKFTDMELSGPILRAIEDMGFEEATAIQTASIPLIMSGRDVTGHSETGTGKTIAFGIPAIEMIDADNRMPQVLVLCPTRELAIQASGEIRRLTKYIDGIKVIPIYGGQPIDRQIKALKQGAQIIIGTPGRVMDHMRRRTLRFDELRMLVLDEADEMLNMGFREDIEIILNDVPTERQTVLFSATMSKPILAITHQYQNNPEFVKVVHHKLTVPGIEQYYCEVPRTRKLESLCRLIDVYDPRLSLVFCNTKRMVDELVGQMQQRGYLVDGLHGDMRQPARTKVMNAFRDCRIDILVATDVAARGIDVDEIEAVFNYDVPQDEEYYVHRIGRTGRAGRTGKSFTFITGRKQLRELEDIQSFTNAKIKFMKVPTDSDVEETKNTKFAEQLREILDEGGLEKHMKVIDRLMEEDYSSVDIAAALVKMAMGSSDVITDEILDSDFDNSGAEPGMVRLFINIGRDKKVRPGDIVGAIAGETGIHGKLIGSIDIYDKFTFVEVPRENAREVLEVMKNSQIKGKKINIEPAKA